MRCLTLGIGILIATAAGCDVNVTIDGEKPGSEATPAAGENGGEGGRISIPGLGVDVQYGEGGVDVKAPGTDVRYGDGKVDVNAPGASVRYGDGEVDVQAEDTSVEVR